MPDPNISKISTFITVPMFNTFSANQSAKVYTSKTPPKNKSQFNQSWVNQNKLFNYIILISKGNGKLSFLIQRLGVLIKNHKTSDQQWLYKKCHYKHSIKTYSWNTRKGNSNIMKHIQVVYSYTFNKKGEEVLYALKSISILKGLNINNLWEQQVLNKLVRTFDEKIFK